MTVSGPSGPPASAPARAALPDGAESIPTYPTRVPAALDTAYRLQRGLISGQATLSWKPEGLVPGSAYSLRLDARIGGLQLLTQVSTGRLDAAGLAPTRFTDQRLRSSARAANFQPERGIVGFSGPSVEYPWVRGVQDRLSWMVQLPAIVAAAPAKAVAGQRITLYVVGARGDAAVWVVRNEGRQAVKTDAGEVQALRYVRESTPDHPHETEVEVWLDPARQYLPVRARLGNRADNEVLELLRTSP